MIINAPRGTADITPDSIYEWHYLEGKIRLIMEIYGYNEIRTPVFEKTELFIRGVGEGTDIVTKEMYTFNDKGGRSITLRPEGTASVVRAYIERGFSAPNHISKFYYISPMFRYERPQAGRLRQHHQFGIEALGSADAHVDVEVIALAMRLYGDLGLNNLVLKINSVGCAECRREYIENLKNYIEARFDNMCGDCRMRYEKNPLRILDCKVQSCREQLVGSPEITSFLCDCCREHFDRVKSGLGAIGIEYTADSRLVRGLDYYTKTTFEIIAAGIGAQDTIAGGGRYDVLVEQLGGSATPAVGFGAGIERLLATLKKFDVEIPKKDRYVAFFAFLDDNARTVGVPIMYECRQRGLAAEMDYFGRSLKAQLKQANRIAAQCVVIIGEDELEKQSATVKDFTTGEQAEVAFSDIADNLLKRGKTV